MDGDGSISEQECYYWWCMEISPLRKVLVHVGPSVAPPPLASKEKDRLHFDRSLN